MDGAHDVESPSRHRAPRSIQRQPRQDHGTSPHHTAGSRTSKRANRKPMSLRGASVVATVCLILAVLALYARRELFANRPLFIILQILAALLMVWARITFGPR